jgi:hypothetical protein
MEKNNYQTDGELDVCDSGWTIPSYNQTSEITPAPNVSQYIPKSPVEFIYCSILKMFGEMCE